MEKDLNKRIAALEREVKTFRSKKDMTHKLLRLASDKVCASDLKDGEIALIKDDINSKFYVMARIEGDIKKAELS